MVDRHHVHVHVRANELTVELDYPSIPDGRVDHVIIEHNEVRALCDLRIRFDMDNHRWIIEKRYDGLCDPWEFAAFVEGGPWAKTEPDEAA